MKVINRAIRKVRDKLREWKAEKTIKVYHPKPKKAVKSTLLRGRKSFPRKVINDRQSSCKATKKGAIHWQGPQKDRHLIPFFKDEY
jgi:hypothetical protein